MLRLLIRIYNSKILRFFFKIIGSLASAMIVISGYLLFLDYSSKRKSDEHGDEDEDLEEDDSSDSEQ